MAGHGPELPAKLEQNLDALWLGSELTSCGSRHALPRRAAAALRCRVPGISDRCGRIVVVLEALGGRRGAS
jgi:hypothetical protein